MPNRLPKPTRLPPFRPTTCRYCGAPITQPHTGRPRRYCSNRCRQAQYRRRLYMWPDFASPAELKAYMHQLFAGTPPVS